MSDTVVRIISLGLFLLLLSIPDLKYRWIPKRREREYLGEWTKKNGASLSYSLNQVLPEQYYITAKEDENIKQIYADWIARIQKRFFENSEPMLRNSRHKNYYKDSTRWMMATLFFFLDDELNEPFCKYNIRDYIGKKILINDDGTEGLHCNKYGLTDFGVTAYKVLFAASLYLEQQNLFNIVMSDSYMKILQNNQILYDDLAYYAAHTNGNKD